MMPRYIVFDVETPNCNNDRMSAIGITIVEEGKIIGSFFFTELVAQTYLFMESPNVKSNLLCHTDNFPSLI